MSGELMAAQAAQRKMGQFGGSIANMFMDSPYSVYASQLQGIPPELEQYLKQATGYLQPFQQAGVSALGREQAQLYGEGSPEEYYKHIMGGYQESPAVQFQKQQGMDSLQNLMAARGESGSGAELKDAMKFSQGLASQGQNQYLQNILGMNQQQLAQLSQMAGMGQQAGTQMGQWTQNTGGNIANLMSQIAAAKGQQQAGKMSDIGNIISNIL